MTMCFFSKPSHKSLYFGSIVDEFTSQSEGKKKKKKKTPTKLCNWNQTPKILDDIIEYYRLAK